MWLIGGLGYVADGSGMMVSTLFSPRTCNRILVLCCSGGFLNDVWTFDIGTRLWTWWTVYKCSCFLLIAFANRMAGSTLANAVAGFSFGSLGVPVPVNLRADTCTNTSAGVLSQALSNQPAARYDFSSTIDSKGQIWLLGGSTEFGDEFAVKIVGSHTCLTVPCQVAATTFGSWILPHKFGRG
jgi:hypothetical protein